MVIKITLFDLIVYIVWNNSNKCGIPLCTYLIAFWTGWLIPTLIIGLFPCVARREDNGKHAKMVLGSFSAIYLILYYSGMTIWGYLLYYSEDNNCRHNSDTRALLVVMLIFMWIGSWFLLFAAFFVLCLPCIIYGFIDKCCREDEE